MSKTIRRKQEKWYFNTHEGVDSIYPFEDSYYTVDVRLDRNSKEYKKKLAKYQSDKKRFRSSVPPWFIKVFFNKPMRQENRIELKKWMLNTETELLLPPYIHNAGWYYF